jgi:hypothetical protein
MSAMLVLTMGISTATATVAVRSLAGMDTNRLIFRSSRTAICRV